MVMFEHRPLRCDTSWQPGVLGRRALFFLFTFGEVKVEEIQSRQPRARSTVNSPYACCRTLGT